MMAEERREGYAELEKKLADHIEEFEMFRSDLLDVIAGPEDSLTKTRSGGMRGEIGQIHHDLGAFAYRERNGGVNAKVKLTFWQKMVVAAMPVLAGAAYAGIATWLGNQG